ncbi:UDP-forming cellulose synthase catalytic subunit [Terriglobus sp.]|uniref:UDP-forming cellulose synthase catalytic subunit n=1 Tax=Terriglobus sp. TaxID=1889013 RepID=UPI003B001445
MGQNRGPSGLVIWMICVLACTLLLLQFISLYLSWQRQALVGTIMVCVCLLLHRLSKAKVVTLALMLVSLAATLRYGWWRVRMVIDFFTDEASHRLSIDSLLMLILLAAEVYTVLIMVLGYMQTSQTLGRKPIPMPTDEDLWPHVDVLIPTYNEPLSLVRYTALAAIGMDYPPEKLHVYILDDGTRAEFRDFAEAAGVGYVVRDKHTHAKAGNINHALTTMGAPLITIFDCDHVPTRSFLQCTVGWFLVEEKLAMLQTPHFFYSPDPFERNLLQYKDVPNEGELFYGVIQDGNDFWNATFFCGSCAVIRRVALDEVGGIATETVTEDAHTSLRMQKKGWNTAYINIAQAAGLATETLAAHVGQRVRWARGMIQILRTDNPLLSSGMHLSQRICYFNAMLHFLYAVPRLVFLLSPLAYMLAGRTIIPGYWITILAYALPHLVLSSLTNSRIQGRHRHSFWNEIYETVLAPYILLPTLLALVNPKLGKFNVTDKGTTLNETVYDSKIATPTTWMLFLLFVGLLVTPYRLFVLDPQHPGVILSNLVWILFNMVILGVAAAVAHEQKQRRSSVRIPVRLQVEITSEAGSVYTGETCDMSVGGASADVKADGALRAGESVRVGFPQQTGEATVTATVLIGHDSNIRLQFTDLTISEEETLTRALYSRADSWIHVRNKVEPDRPLLSLARVVRLSFTGFKQVCLDLLPRKRTGDASAPAAVSAVTASLLALVFGLSALSQTSQPASSVKAAPSPAISETSATPRQMHIAFKDLGIVSTADLRGPHGFYSVHFTLPYTDIPRSASLLLSSRFSSELRAGSGHIQIRLNDTSVGELHAPTANQPEHQFVVTRILLPAELLIRDNDLSFEFDGQPRSSSREVPVLAELGASSRIELTADPLPFHSDISLLPLPLFDSDVPISETITFAFPRQPDTATLQAAGVLASWFGILSSAKPVRFAVVVGQVPAGNAVVFATSAETLPSPLNVPHGASLQIVPNPKDSNKSLLILGGDTSADLLTAARTLSMRKGGHLISGQTPASQGTMEHLDAFSLPEKRKPDDAPRWLPTDRLVSLATYSPQPFLQGDGSRPLPVYFRVAPDSFYGEAQNLALHTRFRYNGQAIAPGSALRIVLNGELVNEAPLSPGTGDVVGRRQALLPLANMRPFANTLLFKFDFLPLRRPGMTSEASLHGLQGTILRETTLDLREVNHYAALPDLQLFSNAGFPFTRFADLGESTVVLAHQASAAEIALFLQLMEHCGRQTGYPVLRVEVAAPEEMTRSDRDYLVLGTSMNQPAFAALDSVLPLMLSQDGVRLRESSSNEGNLAGIWRNITSRAYSLLGIADDRKQLPSATTPADVAIEGIESPYGSGHSLVAVILRDDSAEAAFADRFINTDQSSEISDAVSLLRDGRFQSYSASATSYHVGSISKYMVIRIWLTQQFWLLTVGLFTASLILARGARSWLDYHSGRRLAFPTAPDGSPLYKPLYESGYGISAYQGLGDPQESEREQR